jgi:hypothetical protein
MRIKQHIPNWASGKASSEKFGNLNELLKIDWVARWEENPEFYQFSLSKKENACSQYKYFLMVELKNGSEWWVVGYISGANIDRLALPEWHAPGAKNKEGKKQGS